MNRDILIVGICGDSHRSILGRLIGSISGCQVILVDSSWPENCSDFGMPCADGGMLSEEVKAALSAILERPAQNIREQSRRSHFEVSSLPPRPRSISPKGGYNRPSTRW